MTRGGERVAKLQRWLGGTPSTEPFRRGTDALVFAMALLVFLIVLTSVLPVPYVRFAPGPTFNTVGEVDGTPVISIDGATTYPTSGNLDLTTVSESGGPYGSLTVGDAIRGWRDPTVVILPRDVVFPENQDESQVEEDNAVAFDESQSSAIAASMRYLGKPVKAAVKVAEVADDGPSNGQLLVGDQIVSIAGQPVKQQADVRRIVRSQPIGTPLAFVLLRDDARTTVTVTSVASPVTPGVAYVGVSTEVVYSAEFPITFGLSDVGGPSAGLMFSLGIVDKLTPGQLNGGRFVAGTGTISPEGEVGAIGGIAQKMAGARGKGAEFFLAPASNCDEVVGHVPAGLTVVPVATLTEAVNATTAWVDGRPVASCPASSG